MDFPALELAPLLARRELWLLVSIGFVDPYHRQRLAVLRDAAFRERAAAAAFLAEENAGLELGPGELTFRDVSMPGLFAALDDQWETLETDYRGVFGFTAVSPQCPPCEMEFEPNSDIAYRSQRLADISGFFQAFALDVSGRIHERWDHVAVEAEFMYVLVVKECTAHLAGDQEGVEVCADARRSFFQEHVGWWLPAFSRVLSRVSPSGFYHQLARLTAALSAAERLSLGLDPFRNRVIPKPSSMESPEACSGCIGG